VSASDSRKRIADSRRVASAFCFLLSAFLLACSKKEPPVPPPPTPEQVRAAHIAEAPDDSAERNNLLNIARGAAVVSRTAEITLDNSALRAIDGDPRSDWLTPADDPVQTLTFSLGARSRLDEIGASSAPPASAKNIRYESSLDGKTFTPLATQTLNQAWGDQLIAVKPPVEANYLRVSTLDRYHVFVDLRSVIAHGTEVAPPQPRTIGGCWSINTFPAAIVESGGTAYGWLDQGERMWLDGGFDGRVWRFVFTRGPQIGLIAFSMSPDNMHLSGLKWFEDADPKKLSDSLFGERQKCHVPPPPFSVDVLRTFLERHLWVPLYGFRFDDANQLVPAQSAFAIRELARLIRDVAPRPVRIVSRELRGADAKSDLAASQVRLASLRAELQRQKIDVARVTFVAAGRENYHTAVWSEIMRTMQSGIEMDIPQRR
jgi:F5/8 type C domain